MTRFFSLAAFASLALLAPTSNALAIAGGPFDNGMPSASLEDNAIYQATLKFRNGNGYCYFHPEQVLVAENQANPQAYQARGTISNRSVLYYKGVTYVGGAFGSTDPDAGSLSCIINGSSEASFQQTQQNTQSNFFNFSQSAVTVSNQLTASARNFTVNGQWEGKFTKTAPVRRFTGKGQVAFLSPTGSDSLANLALTSYTNYIGAINAFYSGLDQVTIVGNIQDFFLGGQTAIANALNAIPPFLAGAGLDAAYQNADVQKIRVRGYLRYL